MLPYSQYERTQSEVCNDATDKTKFNQATFLLLCGSGLVCSLLEASENECRVRTAEAETVCERVFHNRLARFICHIVRSSMSAQMIAQRILSRYKHSTGNGAVLAAMDAFRMIEPAMSIE